MHGMHARMHGCCRVLKITGSNILILANKNSWAMKQQ
jgi:hypothetical protein